jgi:hypothetical protein
MARAEGDALVVVTADTEEEAVEIAYRDHFTGIDIGCGIANWVVDYTREVEA